MNTPNNEQLRLFSTPEPSVESSFYDWEIDQEGAEKLTNGSGSSLPQDEANKIHLNDNTNTICSDTWTCFQAVEASAWQQSNLEESRQLSLWRSTPTHKQSCDRIFQVSLSTQTSETTSHQKENSICSQWDSPALAQVTQEVEQDSNIQLPLFGEKDLDVLLKLNPASVLSNNEHPFVPQLILWEHRRCSKELSNEDFELFLGDSLWQDILLRLRQSRRESLGRVIKDSDYLSFPTLTSNASSTNSRPAGQTKCDRWFKDKGLIRSGSQLGTKAIAHMMGFPSDWFEVLKEQYSKNPTTPSLAEPQAESEQGISQDEPLPQDKHQSPSAESSISTQLLGGDKKLLEQKDKRSSYAKRYPLGLVQELSIPCIVKQPKQLEVKGVIKKDEGDRFLVEVDGKEISVSKLFVYPDFSKTVGQIENNPRKSTTPSKENPRKTRRKKGQGNGTIYCRTVTKKGKEYQEAYYHYTDNGKKRTKYIPKKLLDRVKEAESLKLPISEILILLGGDKKNPRKSSNTLSNSVDEKLNDSCIEQVLKTNDLNPRKTTPPSKRKRKQGEGTGYIECKPIKRSGKEYKQYWYHYEEWQGGDRVAKKCRYISQRLVARVEKMNADKVPVEEILKVLKERNKK